MDPTSPICLIGTSRGRQYSSLLRTTLFNPYLTSSVVTKVSELANDASRSSGTPVFSPLIYAQMDAKPMTMHHAIGSWINCSLKSAESCKTPFQIRLPLHHRRCHAASGLLLFSVCRVEVFKSQGLHVCHNSGSSLRKRAAPQQIATSTCNLGRAGFYVASIAYDNKSSQDGAFMGYFRTRGSRGPGHRDAYVAGASATMFF